jgi:putative metalloprotease
MKRSFIVVYAFLAFLGFSRLNAQIKLDENLLGAAQKGLAGLTFSDADA